jgi:geranylgeranyl pyrophosphate synthase
MSETPIQILQNSQGRFRSDVEELFEKRSLEVVRAVSQVIRDHGALKKERDEARELARELRGHLQNLVDHEACNCCHDDEADADWLSAKSALTKAKEVLP